jgi:hypothetical protein
MIFLGQLRLASFIKSNKIKVIKMVFIPPSLVELKTVDGLKRFFLNGEELFFQLGPLDQVGEKSYWSSH